MVSQVENRDALIFFYQSPPLLCTSSSKVVHGCYIFATSYRKLASRLWDEYTRPMRGQENGITGPLNAARRPSSPWAYLIASGVRPLGRLFEFPVWPESLLAFLGPIDLTAFLHGLLRARGEREEDGEGDWVRIEGGNLNSESHFFLLLNLECSPFYVQVISSYKPILLRSVGEKRHYLSF